MKQRPGELASVARAVLEVERTEEDADGVEH